MNPSLRVTEKLESSRIVARAVGVGIAVLCVVLLVLVVMGHASILAKLITVIGAFGVAAFALVATWLPGQRVFSFDRSSVYVTVDRRTTRYGIVEVSVSGEPPRLHLRGQSFSLEQHDYERLAGFLRVVSYNPPRFKPVAAVKQTIIETSRPLRQLFMGASRHPTKI
jgi:hypothetical protein